MPTTAVPGIWKYSFDPVHDLTNTIGTSADLVVPREDPTTMWHCSLVVRPPFPLQASVLVLHALLE